MKIYYCLDGKGDVNSPKDAAWSVLVTDERGAAARFRELGGCVIGVAEAEDPASIDFPEAHALVLGREALTEAYIRRCFDHFHHRPFCAAMTERLVIRESVMEDFEAIRGMLAACPDSVYSKGFDRAAIEEEEGFYRYIGSVYHLLGFGFWTFERRKDKKVIGWGGLFPAREEDEGWGLELGFLVGAPFRGKGYALEACRAILGYAWEELGAERIRIRTDRRNTAAIALARRLGFVRTGAEGGEYCLFILSAL